jgi:hypothetical protein
MPEAATPTGGAEGSARPAPAAPQAPSPQAQQSQQTDRPATLQDRIKASIFPTAEPDVAEGRAPAPPKAADVPQVAKAEAAQNEPDAQGDDAQGTGDNPDAEGAVEGDETNIRSVSELAEGLGWETDRVLDLEVPVKINGKEGKVPLRDALKSYQLEGHLNQGLMKLAEERKGFEGETARKAGEIKTRVEQLNQAVGLAQKILDGEFADVNWQELQRTDPAKFQAMYGAYNMRLDGIRQLNSQVMQEQERDKGSQKAEQDSYLAEQAKLLDSKVPEWSDKGKREKDVAEMVTTLADAYGLTEQEVRSTTDHRLILIARDAAKWQRLQKSKPATLNKVRAAPKLIKPGSQQSRTATEGVQFQKGQANLRRTGKVSDATPLLKKLLFN